MTHTALVAAIAARLGDPLPGAAAQAVMAPRPRGGWPDGFDARRARRAAGLLLLFPIEDRPHLLLTVRSDRVRHGGQVSMPGGVIEAGETVDAAALREAHEEVAVAADQVRVLGQLTPLDIPVSGFRLHPVVGAVESRPRLRASDHEVASILEVPVSMLLDPATVHWRSLTRGGTTLDVPGFRVHGAVVWGATAMVLAEFLTMAGWQGPPAFRGTRPAGP